MYYDDELYHYGIKGMKWGVRKNSTIGKIRKKLAAKAQSRKARKAENKKINKRISEITNAQRRRASETDINKLNDQQLNALNNRIRSENSYKDSIRIARKKNFGFQSAMGVLERNGGKIVDKLAYAGIAAVGARLVAKLLSEEDAKGFTSIVNPKKKSSNNQS